MPIAESPSTTLYQLARGVVSIAEYNDNGVLGAYSDVGNAPAFELETSEETLAHYTSRSKAKRQDEEVTLMVGYTINFTLDEFAVANLAKYVRGTITATQIKALTNLDRKYAIRFTSDNQKGPNEIWNFHRCTLKAAGPLTLISEEWNSMQFTGTGLDDTTNNPTSPYFTIDYQTTTTTTTSTTTTTTTTTTA